MSHNIASTVMRTGASRFDQVGQRLPSYLHCTEEEISHGLVLRLHRYALRRLNEAGFCVSECQCSVYTLDADSKPSEREYCVEFKNQLGGMIGVQGISTNHGHPFLDYGFVIDGK